MLPKLIKNRLASMAGLLGLAVWLVFAPSLAIAADFGGAPSQNTVQPPPSTSKWTFSAEPYGWFIGIHGDVSVLGNEIEINESFIDLVDNNDILAAAMGYFEARNGPIALFADVVWADLDFSGGIQRNFNPIFNLGILVSAKADLDYELTIVQYGAAVEVARWTNGSSITAVDLMGSARYWNHSVDVSARVSATVTLPRIGFRASRSRAFGRSGTLDWTDPVIGARLRHQTASGSEFMFMGDIGGFGVGSDFSWQAFATYGRNTTLLGIPLQAVVGYRALSFDYDENSRFGTNGLDAILHGPVVGAKFRW